MKRIVLIGVLLILAGGVAYYPVWRKKHAVALVNQGIELLQSERWEQALTRFLAAARYDPDLSYAWHNEGVAYGHLQRWDDAASAFRHELRVKPGDPDAFYCLGVARNHLRQYDEAIAALQEAIRLKPDFAAAYHVLGYSFFQTRDVTNALAAYRQAVHYDPSDPKNHYDAGSCLSELGEFEEAIPEFQAAVRLERKNVQERADFRYALGRVLLKTGNLKEAREQQEALRTMDRVQAEDLLNEINRMLRPASMRATDEVFSTEFRFDTSIQH